MTIKSKSTGVGAIALAVLALLIFAGACGCGTCSSDTTWSSEKAFDQIGGTKLVYSTVESFGSAQSSRVSDWNQSLQGIAVHRAGETAADSATAARSDAAKKMLVPIEEVSSSDVLLDISENATLHIKNSIAISYVQFLHNGNLKTVKDISKTLGDAGLSPQDSVVVYGECMPCGGGPAPATLVYWMMRSMGHENVRVLDGTVEDWIAAGKGAENGTATRPPTNYTARFTDRFIATYDYVKSGKPQIVDARSLPEFGAGSIPGAINIPYNSIIDKGKIAEEIKLQKIFAILDKSRPVVVFTAQPTKGSTAWFALELLGYDAKLYSYEDWQFNQKARSVQKILP